MLVAWVFVSGPSSNVYLELINFGKSTSLIWGTFHWRDLRVLTVLSGLGEISLH